MASPNKKLDPKGTGATPSGEGVLANFFNSLLYKKTGVPPGSPGTPGSVGTSPMKLGTKFIIFFHPKYSFKKGFRLLEMI